MLLGSYIFDFIFLKGSHIVSNCITIMALIRGLLGGGERWFAWQRWQFSVNISVCIVDSQCTFQKRLLVEKQKQPKGFSSYYKMSVLSLLMTNSQRGPVIALKIIVNIVFSSHDTFLLSPPFLVGLCVCVFVCVCNIRRGYGNGSRGGREGPDGPAMKSAWACLYQLQLSLSLQWNWSTPETPKSRRRPTHNIVLNGTKKINTQCKWKAGE